ncbi:GTPase IMAP family member 1-like [Polymixia lowei]
MTHMHVDAPAALAAASGLKLLLVGPRRTGKSSVGNTLLGQGQVFETKGGGASKAANGVVAGRHMTVVDAQGWGSSEDLVPREEKVELLRALSLCGTGGPHVILLVIPLLDFTEQERRAVERRMEIFTQGVWRHTMVLFTFGDWLRASGRTAEQHIQSGGPALRWLMEKCRYKYQVMDNKMAAAAAAKTDTLKEERKVGEEKKGGTWPRTGAENEAGRWSGAGEAAGRTEGGQRQVRELLSRVEDTVQENGGWHFSLHMYHRLEEEWSRRAQELSARMEAEREERRGGQEEEEEEEDVQMKGESGLEGEREGRRGKTRERQSSEKDSEEEDWDTGSDSGVEGDDRQRGGQN